jgi:hypothetical protein
LTSRRVRPVLDRRAGDGREVGIYREDDGVTQGPGNGEDTELAEVRSLELATEGLVNVRVLTADMVATLVAPGLAGTAAQRVWRNPDGTFLLGRWFAE